MNDAKCIKCEKIRKLKSDNRCNSCHVRYIYDNKTPENCVRCTKLRKPFAKHLCKSCYQVLRRKPTAELITSTIAHERRCIAQIGKHNREKSGRWKGGRFIDSGGYVRIIPPDDYTDKRIHGGRYVHEHRFIMEQIIGRQLLPTEIVHHINHNRSDNQPENLQLFNSISAHRQHHVFEQALLCDLIK